MKKTECDNMRANANKRRIGWSYEQIAGRFLVERGYRILEYNYYCRYAEIDIVAEEAGYLVFCEVKYRSRGTSAEVLEAVDIRKQRKICRGALFYMRERHCGDLPCRFDVVAINGTLENQITLIKNAFDYK